MVTRFTGVFFFFFSSSRANRATKRSFRSRTVSLSRTSQPSVTGRLGPISRFDLSDTQRVVSVPTVVSAFSRRPFTRTHQTLLFGVFSQIIYTFFQSLIKVYIPFVYLPTYTLPPIYFHPSTDLPPPTRPPTYYLPTHTPTRQSTSTHLHPPNYLLSTYLPTTIQIPIHLPTSVHPTPATHPPTYLPTYQQTQPTFLHPHIHLPAYIPPTTYLYKYLPVPTHLHFYLLTYLPTN